MTPIQTVPAGDAVVLGCRMSGAAFSACGRYRYALWRRWGAGPGVAFIGLNPSTADHEMDDPTIRRCIGFARQWGFGSVSVFNLFAFRATKPDELRLAEAPVGPENDRWLRNAGSVERLVVAAWGVHGSHRGRDRRARALLPDLSCLGITQGGHPRHPLYLRSDAPLQPFTADPSLP